MTHVEGTDPYPWPYDGVLDPTRCALVITGAQRAWADASPTAPEVGRAIARVGLALRAAGSPVVAVVHHRVGPGRRPRRFPPVAATSAADPLRPVAVDFVVAAAGIDGFTGSCLDRVLRDRGIDHLVLTGFGAEASVDSTLRSANDRGYECLVLADAVAPFAEDTGRAALHSVTMSGGIFGAVGTSDALLAAVAATPDPARPPLTTH